MNNQFFISYFSLFYTCKFIFFQQQYRLGMEGNLEIWHGFFSRWTQYYFRIHEDTLIFGPKRQQVEGKVHLKVAQIISIVDDPISFIIHTGTDTLRLRAHSIDERVKWFKKLKKVQKNIEQQDYTKPSSSVKFKGTKGSQIKMLQSIVVDLWQSHAQLQNQIEDISSKFKNYPAMKGLTDKLRMTVQSIKLKNSQALRIIQQYTKSQRQQRFGSSNKNHNSRIEQFSEDNDYSRYHEPDGTKFMSFQDPNIRGFKKNSKKSIEYDDFRDLKQFQLTNKVSKKENQISSSITTPYKMQTPSRDSAVKANLHPIKQRLLELNPVYQLFKKDLNSSKTRQTLPHQFIPEESFSMGSILKGSIGSDLTRFALPVSVNQPLSMLQKGCEQMYYSPILDSANDQSQPEKRMLYVVAFLISQYSVSDLRTKKPFNPLLGQTFEYYDEQRQFDYISQQVSHHPPISAMYCRSNTFQIFDQSQAKTSFTGASIKVTSQGKSKIKLYNFPDEEYIYNKCAACLNGLLIGKTCIEIIGDLKVQCKKTKMTVKVKFHEKSLFKDTLNLLEGQLQANGQKLYTISGRWNQSVRAIELKSKTTIQLWSKKHISNKNYYYFNQFTMLLNHLNKQNLSEVAPTDSRLRPDQRALEYRNIELADSEKLRLQQKQRSKRKENEQKKISHTIKWFSVEKDEEGNQFYIANQNYDDDRKNKSWFSYPDIF